MQLFILKLFDKSSNYRPHTRHMKASYMIQFPQSHNDYYSAQEPTSTGKFELTDVGNAERLIELFGHEIRYVSQWGWLVYDGKRWLLDESRSIVERAKKAVLSIYGEATQVQNDRDRSELLSHAKRSQSLQSIKSMVELAQSDTRVVASAEDFDREPFLFNVSNGTINLHTGDVHEHTPEDMITKLSNIDYYGRQESDVWGKFIDDITDHDPLLQEYLQRIVGYALTGSMREEVFFVLHGTGRNGKSKFLEALADIMGDYAKDAPSSTFMKRINGGGASSDLASLVGARLVTTMETGTDRFLDLPTIKQITGGDPVTCRRLYREFFSFRPQLKLFLATNNKPKIEEDSEAIWRRLKLIPFDVSFVGREDTRLSDKLYAARESILAWAVEGCLKWQESGLQESDRVKNATGDYREDENELRDFFDETCVMGNENEVKARELYNQYKKWCETNRERHMSETAFGSKVTSRGVCKKVHRSTGNYYTGIALKAIAEYHPVYNPNASSNHVSLPPTPPNRYDDDEF